MAFVLEPMRVEDIPRVLEIERESFSTAWPASGYRREILENRLARYLVLRHDVPVPSDGSTSSGRNGVLGSLQRLIGREPATEVDHRPIVGYVGLWVMVDEAHVTTIAVDPKWRGRGLGDLLLLAAFDIAAEIGAATLTLEVREGNTVARRMYEKFSFVEVGRRHRYYDSPTEDAIIMTSDRIDSPGFKVRIRAIRVENDRRVGLVVRNLTPIGL